MSTPPSGRQTGSGAARALPSGRLAGFEDDEAPDMATLLPPRARRPEAVPTSAPAAPAPTAQPDSTVHLDSQPGPAAAAGLTPSPGSDATANAPATGATARKNRIKPSTVHVPARLMPAIRTDRQHTSRSNGELVIAAIEQAHPRLPELLGTLPEPTGGGLFASRASRGARLSDGDLTPLNVRLYEADWDVIDALVAQFHAFSRGHLISTALLDFLDLPSRPQDR